MTDLKSRTLLTLKVLQGTVHTVPADLRAALLGDAHMLAAWQDIMPPTRNEFPCWIIDAKNPKPALVALRLPTTNSPAVSAAPVAGSAVYTAPTKPSAHRSKAF